MTFTKEQTGAIQAKASELMRSVAQGRSARDVMAQLYVSSLEEKTMQQGELMADKILQSVKDFDADYQAAQEDLDGFVEAFQNKMDEGRTCVERCNYWLKLGAAISAAAMGQEAGSREEIIRTIEGMSVSEEEATPQREAELRESAAQAIKNSGILLGTLAEQAKALEELDSAEQAAGLLLDLGGQEFEYRAVVAMAAYTMVKNGELEGVPVDMTAAQVTAAVCAEMEAARIAQAVEKGSLAVDVAAMLLGILGSVVLMIYVALPAAIIVTQAILTMFIPILAIPLCILAVAGIIHLYNKVVDECVQGSKEMLNDAIAGARAVAKGMKAVGAFAMDRVLPKVVETAKGIWEKLKNLAAEVTEPAGVKNRTAVTQ